MQRAHLLSNAFITIEEAPGAYDQIRGTEMVAYFDSTNALTRFDALGGASSLFYLEENGALATVNKVESKMIYATFADGQMERIYYYDNPKNDGYPTVQLPEEDKTLKGFRWDPERRPASARDVTALVPRRSERMAYLARPHAAFRQTDDYFPGHIGKYTGTLPSGTPWPCGGAGAGTARPCKAEAPLKPGRSLAHRIALRPRIPLNHPCRLHGCLRDTRRPE